MLLLFCCCHRCCCCSVVVCLIVYLLLLSLFLLFLCCYRVKLIRAKKGEIPKKGGDAYWNNFRVKSRGAISFPSVKISVFLFLSFEICIYVSSKHSKNRGFSN